MLSKQEAKKRRIVGILCFVLCFLNGFGIFCGLLLVCFEPSKAPSLMEWTEMIGLFLLFRFVAFRFMDDYYKARRQRRKERKEAGVGLRSVDKLNAAS